jgi:AmiR/NasT family two-component response regulator
MDTVLDFRALRVLVIHPRDSDGQHLERQLMRLGCQVTACWPSPPDLPPEADTVFCLVDQENQARFAWLADRPAVATIAVLGRSGSPPVRAIKDLMPQAIVLKPCEPQALLTNLVMAHNNFRYERRLLSKIGKLEETLRSVRKVEQAKTILMKQRQIDEASAYEHLRRQAMQKRVPIGVIAAAVLDASEVLTGD